MATLYEQIQQALNEDVSSNEIENLSATIHGAIRTLWIQITGNYRNRNSDIKSGFEKLGNSLDSMLEKLIELESRIEQLENKGL